MMQKIIDYAWLIPSIPFFSFLIVGLGIQFVSKQAAGIVATLSIFVSAALSYLLAYSYFTQFSAGELPVLLPWSMEWVNFKEHLTVHMGVMVDSLSVIMMVVVTTVSALVHMYSIGYMKGEVGYGRYFTVLNLFTFSMLGLVTSPNIVSTFVFWELVGASSFFLIGFYYQKPSAVDASKKAFIVTRFADLGFLIGILTLGYVGLEVFPELMKLNSVTHLSALDISFLVHPATVAAFGSWSGTLTFALIMIFIGAAGKSAMFPLHIWLPDAMEGPTPVSALIHAATMVTAGVFLVARFIPLYMASDFAMSVVSFIGAFTCLFAAVIACTQDDIKRILAFSTLSQLGYMMLALGVITAEAQSGYTASIFHLFTHAFFKALLFLGAGSVIHAVHSNDIWKMGGLRKLMPITHLCFLVACLAIAGIFPFAGFFSKDAILISTLNLSWDRLLNPFCFIVALAVAGITAFYMFRLYFVVFWGRAKTKAAEAAHESPLIMTIPLIVLALYSCLAGWVPFNSWVRLTPLPVEDHSWFVPILATLVGLAGILFAWWNYFNVASKEKSVEGPLQTNFRYVLVQNKFFIDDVYMFLTKDIIFKYIAAPAAWFDRHIVDGTVNLTGKLTRFSGAALSLIQTGQVQSYGIWFAIGTLVVLLLLL